MEEEENPRYANQAKWRKDHPTAELLIDRYVEAVIEAVGPDPGPNPWVVETGITTVDENGRIDLENIKDQLFVDILYNVTTDFMAYIVETVDDTIRELIEPWFRN